MLTLLSVNIIHDILSKYISRLSVHVLIHIFQFLTFLDAADSIYITLPSLILIDTFHAATLHRQNSGFEGSDHFPKLRRNASVASDISSTSSRCGPTNSGYILMQFSFSFSIFLL